MRLSIVVNMYNTAKYMPKCIDSLLKQDIPASDYEIILVDDCSPDNSLSMAMEYQAKSEKRNGEGGGWPKIKVCHHEVNKGLAGGRNTGIDAAEGEYLCFVDSDDYIEKNSLKALLNQMDAEQLDMLRFNYQKVDETYKQIPDNVAQRMFDYTSRIMTGIEFIATRLGVECYVWAYIYRLAMIKDNNIRFYEKGYFDDTPWLPRVLMAAERVNVISTRHQYYLQRSGSLVHTMSKASVVHKINGQMTLITELLEQKKSAPRMVGKWYKTQISFMALSLLSTLSIGDYASVKLYINQLKARDVFPLKLDKVKMTYHLKALACNCSPTIYCWGMHKLYGRI